MTSIIKVEGINNVIKPNAVKWKRSVTEYSDTATIKLPAIAMLKSKGQQYNRIETGQQFREGMQVEIACGYDNNNTRRFAGFIRRINPTIPLEIECEGYSYPLRKILNFNKSYRAGTKLKTILADLVSGTNIQLSNDIPDVIIESPRSFDNKTGTQVLDWLKEKLLMSVYFNFNQLYVGPMQTEFKKEIKLRMGWNVIQDNELKYNDKKELANVRVRISFKSKNGKLQTPTTKHPNTKLIIMDVRVDDATQKKIEEDQRRKLVSRGYEGAITTFLTPYAEPGMAVTIDDAKYPARAGKYFIEAVEGDFSSSGGRQKIKIGPTL